MTDLPKIWLVDADQVRVIKNFIFVHLKNRKITMIMIIDSVCVCVRV